MAANNLQSVYDGLVQRGFSAPQAAALTGNIEQESSGSPTAYNAKSQAYGLLNWRGPRLAALNAYAQSTGRDPSDQGAQLDFIVHEMQGSEAPNVKAFLSSQDVAGANNALRSYIRYGTNEAGNRLMNSIAFAKPTNQLTGATNAGPGGFVNPAFSGGVQPLAAPAAQPAVQAPAQPAASPATPQQSDDDLLKAWSGSPDPLAVVGDRAEELRAAQGEPANDDEALLQSFMPKGQQTPGALGNNPMAVRKSNAQASDYKPSSVPILDQVSAFGNAAANAVPVVGPALSSIGNNVDAAFNNALAPVFGFQPETAADVAQNNAAQAAQYPLASTAGAITGTVGPLVAGGATALGGKLLGTTGNLLTRTVAGGLSSGALGGADTLARGGNLGDAARNALIDTALGGAMAPAGSAIAGGGKNMLLRAGTGAGAGAAIGGAGTLASGGTPEQAEANALRGAAVGAGAGVVGSTANKLLAAGTSPEVAALAQTAIDKYGIPLGPGQISTNPLIRRADALVNKIPLSGGTASSEAQNQALTKAIATEMGTPSATALTPAVMGSTKARISSVFQNVANNTKAIPADPQFDNDMLGIMSAAQASTTPQQLAPLNSQFDDIMKTFQNGGNAIDGKTYLSMTARGSPLDAAVSSSDPAIATYAGQMKDALDDAMQRAASPADQAALTQARYQWKVMRTVEDLAEKAPTGAISPALLMGAVRKNFPNMAYDGGGNMGELARIASQFMKEPSSSGSAENLKLIGGLTGAAGLALNPGLIPAAAGTAAAIVAGGRAAGTALRSKALANTMINGGLGTSHLAATPNLNMLLRAAPPALQAPGNQNLLLGPIDLDGIPRVVVRGATPVQ